MPNSLGRGLNSLIPNKSIPVSKNFTKISGEEDQKTIEIDPNLIEVNSLQPRKQFNDSGMDELVESIKEYGVIQPLLIHKKENGRYELIAGERRLRASKKLGLKKVPVIFRQVSEQQKLEVALIENIQREDLNTIDLAAAYRKLMDEFGLSQDEVAKKIGKPRSSVANTLRMLNLPEEIQVALADKKISEGHAKYLVGLDSESKQNVLFRKIIHNNLTVMDTDKESKKMGGTKNARIKINYTDKDKEFAFREFFGTKVEIRRKGRGGQIIIDFFSDDELREMAEKVKRK